MIDARQGTLAVSRDIVKQLPKASDPEWLDSVVSLYHNGEERYMASLEIFHQVHCLVKAPKTSSNTRDADPVSDRTRLEKPPISNTIQTTILGRCTDISVGSSDPTEYGFY